MSKSEGSKEKKIVLFISDDFSRNHFDEVMIQLIKPRYPELDFRLVDRFDYTLKHIRDRLFCVFVDYGLIGDIYNVMTIMNIDLLEYFYFGGVPIIWCGGLACRYPDDCRLMFPDKKFLHNLRSCYIGYDNILRELGIIMKKVKSDERL